MNCINAQYNILPFINRSLDEDDMLDFLEHIEECEECRNELEIYYMIYMGYNRLETFEEPASYNLKGQMEKELKYMKIYVKISRLLILLRCIAATAAACICIMIFADFFILGNYI